MIQMSISKYLDKETIHTWNTISMKKKQTTTIYNNLNESKKKNSTEDKTQKGYTLFDFIYMKFQKRQNS